MYDPNGSLSASTRQNRQKAVSPHVTKYSRGSLVAHIHNLYTPHTGKKLPYFPEPRNSMSGYIRCRTAK